MKRSILFLVVILPCLFYPPQSEAFTRFTQAIDLCKEMANSDIENNRERICNLSTETYPDLKGLVSRCISTMGPPIANAVGGILHCSGQMQLNAFGSTEGGHISYFWTTNDGSIVSGENSMTPTIDRPGTYTLLVVDNNNQSSSSISVVVLPSTYVNAGSPILYCEDELPLDFNLNGSISGPYLGFYWSPSANLIDPTILDPWVLATPGETHELNVEVLSGINLIVNGNFESGNSNFYSQYIYGSDVAGKYLITNNPKEFYNGFAACGDHTTGWGNMMVLDGSALPNQKVWCQEIEVTQNTTYAFSAWFQNVCATCLWGEPIIDFRANGESLGIVQKSGDGCIWEKFSSYWNSGNNLTAEFCLFTHELDPIGNDFAIDDIEVLASCIMTDEVEVKFDDISADFEFSSLTCDVSEVNLFSKPTGTDISNVSYSWSSTDGRIIQGQNSAMPLVQGDGVYNLIITNENTSCFESLEFILEGDFTAPDLSAIAPTLTCNESEAFLEGFSETADVRFIWSTEDGNIISGQEEQSALVDKSGIYFLEVVNNKTGCSSSMEVFVEEDFDVLEIEILQPDNISCQTKSINLETDLDLADYSILWNTSDGNILEGKDSSTPLVDKEGTYEIQITDLENGCTAVAEVEVLSDIQIPDLNLGEDKTIGCGDVAVGLSASSNESNISFAWSTVSGKILNGENLADVQVGAFGFYTVVVTNMDNGCTNEGVIEVVNDNESPFVDTGSQKELTCALHSVRLDASNSETGDHLTYLWSTTNGNILEGKSSLTPLVDKAGAYELTITNTLNLCETKSRVNVVENKIAPNADAGRDEVINCYNESVSLGREYFSQSNVEFSWSTLDGQIGGASDQSVIQAISKGTYTMQVSNLLNGCSAIDEVVVVEDFAQPNLSLSSETVELNCTSNELEINSISDQNELSYSWETSNGLILSDEISEQVRVGSPGDYTLVITDENNGCTNLESIQISGQFDLPQIDIHEPEKFICGTETVRISAFKLDTTEDLEVIWSTTDGLISSNNDDFTINVSKPGSYSVLATNRKNGCSIEKLVEVKQDQKDPEINLYSDEILTCGLTQVEVRSESEMEGLIYNWTTSTGTILSANDQANIQVSTAGTYILTVTNTLNNCNTIKEVDVFADISEPIIVIADPEQLTCETLQITLDASLFSNSSLFDVSWSTQNGNIVTGASSLTPSIDQPGDYLLTIKNMSNECLSSQAINVAQNIDFPTVEMLQAESLNCFVPQIPITLDFDIGSNLSFEWNTSNGQINSDPSLSEILVDQAGTYELVVANLENGCTMDFKMEIQEDFTIPNIDAGNDFEIDCDFMSINLNGTIRDDGNFETEWFTQQGQINGSNSTLEPLINEAGLYYLHVLNKENGCQSIDSVLIYRNENIPSGILTSVEPPLCYGDKASVSVLDIIGGEGPYLYNLDSQGFQTNPDFESLNPGQHYSLVIQDANGCEKDTSLIMPSVQSLQVHLIPEVNLIIGDSHNIYVQTNIPEETIAQIAWSPATYLSCTDCLNPEIQPLADQLYELVITTENGCVEKAQILFKVDRDIKVYAPTAFTPFDGDGTNDKFHLFAAENTVKNISEFRIFDRWGNEMFSQTNAFPNDEAFAWDGKYRNKNASQGVYVWFAKLELITGEIIELNGDITLLD